MNSKEKALKSKTGENFAKSKFAYRYARKLTDAANSRQASKLMDSIPQGLRRK